MDEKKPRFTTAAAAQGKIDYRPLVAGKPVLVVVDMQSRFAAANCPTTIAAVEAEIKAARARQEPIVVLELAIPSLHPEFHRTHKRLLEVLDEPDNQAFWVLKLKSTVDGSKEVLTACRSFGFSTEHFRIVGVNTSMCVYETAVGIARRCPGRRVEVLAHAVNDSSSEPWLNYELVAHMVQVV